MADMKWVKLATSLPDHRKIKRIRKMPDGNNIILFWVFLLARAGESNRSGGLYMTETMPYSVEDLAADFDFSVESVEFSLLTLEKYAMIERYEDIIFIKNWEEYQSVESFEKIREQNRIRQARYREKQKQLALSADSNVTSNDEITENNGTELELELELELDKELDKDKDIMSDKVEPRIHYQEIVSYLNEKAGTAYRHTSKKTQTLIKARINEGFTVDDFKKVVDIKTAEWLGDTSMSRYLRPETLFGNKFESYLNQKQAVRSGNSGTSEYDNLF